MVRVRRGRGWGARLALLLAVGCSSSSTPPPAPATTTPGKCSCSVSVNGQDATIACREEACLGGTSYRCSADATIAKGGACASGPDASAPDGGGTACEEPPCVTDTDCTPISASWRCFALDRPDAKKACFPTETIIFQGDNTPSCLEESRRIVTASCQDGDTPICVPTACQAAANQPAPTQARTCR
jgi:hypothetical protein